MRGRNRRTEKGRKEKERRKNMYLPSYQSSKKKEKGEEKGIGAEQIR